MRNANPLAHDSSMKDVIRTSALKQSRRHTTIVPSFNLPKKDIYEGMLDFGLTN